MFEGMRVEVKDKLGLPVPGAEPDMGALDIGEKAVAFDQAEAAAIKLLATTRNLLHALGRMVGTPVQGDRRSVSVHQLTSDHADSTVKLAVEVAKHAVKRMEECEITEQRLLAARMMAVSYLEAMRKVNVERDSVPGIVLIKGFLPLFHVVLSVRYDEADKGKALADWAKHRERALKQV